MPIVTVSSKNQITLPAEIVRAFDIKAGEKLIIEGIQWRIVMVKESENKLERYVGSLKGVYGSTKEEIDRYIAEERRGWDRDEWLQQFEDVIAADPAAERIVDILLESPRHTLSEPDLRMHQERGLFPSNRGFASSEFEEILEKLVVSGGVRRLPSPPGIMGYKYQYRLVLEAAERYQRERTSRATK